MDLHAGNGFFSETVRKVFAFGAGCDVRDLIGSEKAAATTGAPHAASGNIDIEALVLGQEFGFGIELVTGEVPLSDEGGAVAVLFEGFGDGLVRGLQ